MSQIFFARKRAIQKKFPGSRPGGPRPRPRPPGTDFKFKNDNNDNDIAGKHFFASSCAGKALVSYVDLLSDPSSHMPGQVNSISNYHVVVIADMLLAAICSEKIKRFRSYSSR